MEADPTVGKHIQGRQNTSFSNIDQEDGNPSTVDVDLAFNTGAFTPVNTGFAPPANQIPTSSSSTNLGNLSGAVTGQGSATLTISGLNAGSSYELYVFGGDAFAGAQQVTVTAPVDGALLDQFTQTFSANELLVNDEAGLSARDLSSYARFVTADINGELSVTC